jgi:glutamate carboxypeptidase
MIPFTPLHGKILQRWLQTQQPGMTRLLGRLVRFETPSFDKAAVDRLGRLLAAEWNRRGCAVRMLRQKDRGDHLRVEWKRSSARRVAPILVLGHMDTVYPAGSLARSPFRVAHGRAWGPGTFDMKAGLVIALFAVDALLAHDLAPTRPVIFLWTSDEEIGSQSSRAAIEREARRAAAVLVMEPASGKSGKLKTGRKAIGEIEIVAAGRAAHAGLNPGDGINAIEEISRQIIAIKAWDNPQRGITVNPGVIEGGSRSNVIPDRARVLVDIRATHAGDMQKLEKRFRNLRPFLPGAKLRISGGFTRPPLERIHSVALYRKARRAAEELGMALGEDFVGGGSDGNFTAALGVPTLDGMGAVGTGAHSERENISVRDLPKRAALLAGLLMAI